MGPRPAPGEGVVRRVGQKHGEGPAQRPFEPYRRKRDFGRTPEPSGSGSTRRRSHPRTGCRFVVNALGRRLLEQACWSMDGLAAMVVEDDPRTAERVRRSAVRRGYLRSTARAFTDEAVAVKGGEGSSGRRDGGPHETEDPTRGGPHGRGTSTCSAKRLRGRFALVRTGRPERPSDKEQWLLLHKHDADAVSGLGRGGPPHVRAQWPHERRRSRRHRTGCGARTCRPPRPPACPRPVRRRPRPRTSWRHSLTSVGRGRGRSSGRTLKVATSTRSSFPPEPARSR